MLVVAKLTVAFPPVQSVPKLTLKIHTTLFPLPNPLFQNYTLIQYELYRIYTVYRMIHWTWSADTVRNEPFLYLTYQLPHQRNVFGRFKYVNNKQSLDLSMLYWKLSLESQTSVTEVLSEQSRLPSPGFCLPMTVIEWSRNSAEKQSNGLIRT